MPPADYQNGLKVLNERLDAMREHMDLRFDTLSEKYDEAKAVEARVHQIEIKLASHKSVDDRLKDLSSRMRKAELSLVKVMTIAALAGGIGGLISLVARLAG